MLGFRSKGVRSRLRPFSKVAASLLLSASLMMSSPSLAEDNPGLLARAYEVLDEAALWDQRIETYDENLMKARRAAREAVDPKEKRDYEFLRRMYSQLLKRAKFMKEKKCETARSILDEMKGLCEEGETDYCTQHKTIEPLYEQVCVPSSQS